MNVQSTGGGRGSRRKPMGEINVVPYIDVSLVLLIIFMITTPLLQSGVDVDLPNAEAKSIDPANDPPLIVSIQKDGSFFVNIGGQGDEAVDAASLSARVLEGIKDKPNRPVLIRGDKAVEYGQVIQAMAALKQAGVPTVGLMTSPLEK